MKLDEGGRAKAKNATRHPGNAASLLSRGRESNPRDVIPERGSTEDRDDGSCTPTDPASLSPLCGRNLSVQAQASSPRAGLVERHKYSGDSHRVSSAVSTRQVHNGTLIAS